MVKSYIDNKFILIEHVISPDNEDSGEITDQKTQCLCGFAEFESSGKPFTTTFAKNATNQDDIRRKADLDSLLNIRSAFLYHGQMIAQIFSSSFHLFLCNMRVNVHGIRKY